MKVRLEERLIQKLQLIKRKDPRLAKQIQKQLKLFKENPKLKSLRVHKLSRKLKDTWSISITKSIRMVYKIEGEEAYFFDLGTHDEVYKN